jgi:nucleotide-binding universal stress UspA family protein
MNGIGGFDMKEFKRILFPVDLSESSTKIVPYVQAVAEKFEAKIYILFAARVFDYFTSMYVPYPSISSFEKEIIEGAEKRLYEFMDEHFSNFPNTKTVVVAGDASDEILNYIEDQHIDLVIMGTHGRKGMDKIIFGSVAERVVKTSPVPVMVVNPYKTG